MSAGARTVAVEDIAAARARIADVARRTPVLPSATLTERLDATVWLKAESLQRTGSFKLRGATNKVSVLGDACARGVVAGSAGNHALALAHAARARGVPCEVFMPGASASPPRPSARRAAAWRWSTRSTTPTSSRARARSGSSCSRTCPTSPRS